MDSVWHSTSQDRVRSEGNPKELDSQGTSGEVVDEMIEGMWKAERINALWWLKELQQPKRYISTLSGKGKDLIINVQIETLENQTTLATKVLVDSGCTSSAINRSFIKQHNVPTHAMAAPIPIYIADRT